MSITERIIAGDIEPRETVFVNAPLEIVGAHLNQRGGYLVYTQAAEKPVLSLRRCTGYIKIKINAGRPLGDFLHGQTNTCLELIDCHGLDVDVHGIGGDCTLTATMCSDGRYRVRGEDPGDNGVYVTGDNVPGVDAAELRISGQIFRPGRMQRSHGLGAAFKRDCSHVVLEDFQVYDPRVGVATLGAQGQPPGSGIRIRRVDVFRSTSRAIRLHSGYNIVEDCLVVDPGLDAVGILGEDSVDNIVRDLTVVGGPGRMVRHYRGADPGRTIQYRINGIAKDVA